MGRKRKEGRIRRGRESGRTGNQATGKKRGVRGNASMRPPTYTELSLAPPDLVNRAVRHKLPWIQRFVTEGCPRGQLLVYAEQAKLALNLKETVPPYTTLKTWAARYAAFGTLGLVDSVPGHAGTSYALCDKAKLLLRVAMIGGKHGITEARAFVMRFLGTALTPSYNTCLREIHRLRREQPHLVAMAHFGRKYFENVFRLAIAQGALPAGFRYEVDSTVADIWVRVPDPRNPGKWIAVRPVLTVVVDSGSRALLAFNLSLSAVDSGIVLGTVQRAIDSRWNYPGLISLGVPHQAAVDQGAEHRGAFLDVMTRLGVEVLYGIPNEPQGRARVERLIQTITREVMAHMPGYSKTHKRFDPYAPADADAKRSLTSLKYDEYKLELLVEQLPTLPQLEANILGWGSVYNDRPHPGLPTDSPELRRLIELAAQVDRDMNTQEAA